MILWSSRGTCGVLFIILTDITFEQNKKFPLLYVFLRSPKCIDPILGPFANQSPRALNSVHQSCSRLSTCYIPKFNLKCTLGMPFP